MSTDVPLFGAGNTSSIYMLCVCGIFITNGNQTTKIPFPAFFGAGVDVHTLPKLIIVFSQQLLEIKLLMI